MTTLQLDTETSPSSGQAQYLLRLKIWVPPSKTLARLIIAFIQSGNGLGNTPSGRDGKKIAARIIITRNYLSKYLDKNVSFVEQGVTHYGRIDRLVPKPNDLTARQEFFGTHYQDDKKPFYGRVTTQQGKIVFLQLGSLTLL